MRKFLSLKRPDGTEGRVEKRSERIEQLVLSVLTGWFCCLFFSVTLNPYSANGKSSATFAQLIVFCACVLIFALPVYILTVKKKSSLSAYALFFSMLSFFCALLLQNSDPSVYIVCFIVLMLTGRCLYEKTGVWRLHRQYETKKLIIFAAAVVSLAFLNLLFVNVFRYLCYSAPNYDFGIFCNMFYNMRKNLSMLTTCERDEPLSHLAVHCSPIFYVLLPLYFIFPSPVTLAASQPIIVFSAVIPLILIAKRLKLSSTSVMLVAVVFALYAPLSTGCYYDLHENCFMVPLLLWMFYFNLKNNVPLTFLFAVLTLMVKEDAFIYVCIFALYVILDSKKPMRGACLLALSVIYFAGVSTLMTMYGEGLMSNRYSNLSSDGSLLGTAKTLLMNTGFAFERIFNDKNATSKKLFYFFQMLAPLVFLPLRTKKYSRYLLVLPILVNLLTEYKYQYDIGFQYSFSAAAFMLYMSVLCVSDFQKRQQEKNLAAAALSCLMLFSAMCFGNGLGYVLTYIERADIVQANSEMIEFIPENASVTASAYLVPHLAQRDIIYEDEYHDEPSTEYFVLDLTRQGNIGREKKYVDAGYVKVFEKQDIVAVYHNPDYAQ